jgi:hypothetical protein
MKTGFRDGEIINYPLTHYPFKPAVYIAFQQKLTLTNRLCICHYNTFSKLDVNLILNKKTI